jgi:hypothetical protein
MGGARGQEEAETFWSSKTPAGEVQVNLHLFWSETCPHCAKAQRFMRSLGRERPWLLIHSYEVTGSPANRELFVLLAASLGEQIRGVPAFFLCGQMVVGFDDAAGAGAFLASLADDCHAFLALEVPVEEIETDTASQRVHLPYIGNVDVGQLSLPVLTLILGGVDAFNPCAFFVLLFLLSLLVHARSRARMLLIGGIFVLFSGLLYFIFMAAWLNLFLVLEGIRVVTFIAGLVAVALAVVNIKDFFLFKRGLSLSIPETTTPGLFARMRGLLSADNLPTLLTGTMTLAIAANTYELLCTSAFPLVYTRALTLSNLSTPSYYVYLAFYNVIYVVPLLVIVLTFTLTLGSRKLSEMQGRVLKLFSGLMMLGLGLVLLVAPDLLDNWLTAVALLMLAALATGIVYLLDKLRLRSVQ